MHSSGLDDQTSDLSRMLREAYDQQLRGANEMLGAQEVTQDGPLYRGVFKGRRGFVSYCALDVDDIDALIARTVAHFASKPEITSCEWKTRGHDAPADLPQRLLAHGFEAEDEETVMVGEAALLAAPVELPEGVRLRRIGIHADGRAQSDEEARADLVRASRMQAEVFGRDAFGDISTLAASILGAERVEFWVAEAGNDAGEWDVVSAGRFEVVPGTEFASIWGGSTLPAWRGRGIYRALTAARARSVLARGARYIHSDSTSYSRPILERSGFLAVTTTTPYVWSRPAE